MTMIVAAAQMQSSTVPAENLYKAQAAVKIAAGRGAGLVVFPEIFMANLPVNEFKAQRAREVSQSLEGPFVTGLSEAARQSGVWVIAGMLETAAGTPDKTFNTTVVLDEQGNLVAFYRKTHLFDAFGYKESDVFAKGDDLFKPLQRRDDAIRPSTDALQIVVAGVIHRLDDHPWPGCSTGKGRHRRTPFAHQPAHQHILPRHARPRQQGFTH